jgi:hypothetical protein
MTERLPRPADAAAAAPGRVRQPRAFLLVAGSSVRLIEAFYGRRCKTC